jgi:type II secretory ATPase GspE/PulE/Tfp pilus assembly ATPase PilB-like protein
MTARDGHFWEDASAAPVEPTAEVAPFPSSIDRKHAYQLVLEWLRRHANLSSNAETAAAKAALLQNEPLPLTLNRMGAVSDGDLQAAFIAVSRKPVAIGEPDPEAREDISIPFLRAHRALVLKGDDGLIHLALVDPFDEEAIRGVRFATGLSVSVSVMRASEQRRLFAQTYEDHAQAWTEEVAQRAEDRSDAALEFDRDAPIARRVAGWLAAAVDRRASDVHIEPRSNVLCIRFRIDGILETVAEEPLAAAASVLARIKVLADLDLGERRASQDGRTTIIVSGRPIDLRVSVVPSVHGEAAVLRILDRGEVKLSFDTLGFSPRERNLLDRAITWPNGLFLVTGPTGSGKTTTLYAGLEAMRHSSRKILTIEDPVEFHFDHVTQVQNAPKAGVTFPSAIRAFLRQDPDVILVGEIRDGETARAAVQAALTGHLVLATLHAIDAPRTAPRLLDMGVEPFQLAACFRGALSQRLVRALCPACRRARPARPPESQALQLPADATVYDAVGCEKCSPSGFYGRIAIAEGFEASDAFLSKLLARENLAASGDDYLSRRLHDDGAAKAMAGLTTCAEVMRALSG